jgi:hypothetical protein
LNSRNIGSLSAKTAGTMMAPLSRSVIVFLIAVVNLQLVHSYLTGSSVGRNVGRLSVKSTSFLSANRIHRSLQLSASSDKTVEKGLAWKSVVSTNADLDEAVNEIIASVSLNNEENVGKYNLAIFFTSSIYEASAFKYDDLFETLSKKMPGMKTMIGCTTGTAEFKDYCEIRFIVRYEQ